MLIERRVSGRMPYAATGAGPVVVALPGLAPITGVAHDALVQSTVSPLAALAASRRLVVLNRYERLPVGMSLRQLAAEHAAALEGIVDSPVDLLGTSTGGSIAQQLAADRPDLVRRLVVASSACRLAPETRRSQGRVAELIRAERWRRALASMAGELVPPWWGRTLARSLAYAFGPRVLGDRQALADMATTIEAEEAFDLSDLPVVAAPTLIIAGGRDRFYPRALFDETARLIPGAVLCVFPRRGHVTVLNDRRARATIVGFLQAPAAS